MMSRALLLALCTAAVLSATGCSSSAPGPYSAGREPARNPLEAQRLTDQALDVIGRNPEKAEELLRRALDADLFYGPAHNNLGVLYLQRGDLYGAATEFEWAARLIPGHPDPRLNLAMTLERAGRYGDAVEEYRGALEAHPGHIQSIQALTRCQLRYGGGPAAEGEIEGNLREIALRGESPEWRAWAARRLAVGR